MEPALETWLARAVPADAGPPTIGNTRAKAMTSETGKRRDGRAPDLPVPPIPAERTFRDQTIEPSPGLSGGGPTSPLSWKHG